jgi:hypothetical protein
MSTEAISPLRQRMIEDMRRVSSVRARREATSGAANVSLRCANSTGIEGEADMSDIAETA